MENTHNIEPNELDGETSYLNYRDGMQSHKEQSLLYLQKKIRYE